MTDISNPWVTPPAAEKPDWLTTDLQLKLRAMNYPENQDGLLMLHKNAQETLSFWKEEEMELRKITAAVLVPAKTEGTTNVELGQGYVAKVVHKYNYKLASDNDVVWACLDKIGSIGNQGKFIAERLVSWTPNFLKTEYTTLQEEAEKGSVEAKQILDIVNSEMLMITEAAPTLSINEPKAKKK